MRTSPQRLIAPELEAYIGGVVERLIRRPAPDLRIYVMRDASLNAAMLPTGMMIVNTGLLVRVRNEAQLAAVLAHEAGHIRHRHGMRTLVQTTLLSSITALAFGDFSTVLAGAPALLGHLGYSRDFEREADSFAESAMAAAGFDARPVAGFFARLAAKENSGPAILGVVGNYLSTHPDSAERAEVFARSKPGSAALTAERFAALKPGQVYEI